MLAGHQRAVLRAAVAQQAGQLAGVDVGDGDDAALRQPLRQRAWLRQLLGRRGTSRTIRPAAQTWCGFVVLVGAAGVADVRDRSA